MSETKESFVPKILADYHQNNRTGILTLKQKSVNKTIHFENGVVVFATTNVEAEQLGTRLLEWGLLTPEQLVTTDKLAKENRRFGKSLVDLGFFQADELPDLFYRQTTRIMFSTFDWKNFDFRFTRCALPEYEVKNSIPVPQALLEGLRYLEDINSIKESLGDLNKSLKLNLPLANFHRIFTFTSQEANLLAHLENKVFVPAKLLITNATEIETVIKTLCVLSLLGMLTEAKEEVTADNLTSQMNDMLVEKQSPLEVTQPPYRMPTNIGPIAEPALHSNALSEINSPNKAAPATSWPNTPNSQDLPNRKLMEFCYEIENKVRAINRGASVYEVLEVDTHSSLEQINASYQKLIERFHLNRQKELLAYNTNTDFSDNLNYISTAIKQAYEILTTRSVAPKPVQNTQPMASSKSSGTPNSSFPSNAPSNQVSKTPPLIASTPPTFSTFPTPSTLPAKPVSPQITPAATPKLPNQQEVMELCYLIENKLNMIQGESTHYQVLEIERSATRETIDQAYQELMLKFDLKKQESLSAYGLNMNSQLEEISKAVRLAAEVLRDPQKKQLYDERIGKSLRRNTGQYSTISQSDLKQPTTASHSRIETKYPSAPQYSSQPDTRYSIPQSKSVTNPMPSLTTDSKIRSQQETSTPNSPTSLSNYPALNQMNNSSAGQRIPSESFPPSTQASQNSLPYGQRNLSDDPNRSSPGNKISNNANPPASPVANRISGSFELNRSNPGAKPSITIDPTRNSLPTFTPIAASKANPAQPAQLAQPAQPFQAKPSSNAPVTKAPTPAPHSELPQANKSIPGGKGKTFTATEYYLRSIELCDQKKYTDAIESLLMALKLSPKDGEYWAQLARAYSNIDGYEKDTVAAYQKANEYSPREVGYLLELGDFLRKHGHRQKAAEVYSGVLNLRPQNVKAQTALAELVHESKNDDEEDTKSRGFWSKWLKQS